MTTGHGELEAAIERLCGSCAGRRGCTIEGAARVYWPEHQNFPAEWQLAESGWRCSAYLPPRLTGIGRIDDPSQVEMFATVEIGQCP